MDALTDRLSDWETRFADYLAEATIAVRAGRENFCALFAAGAVEAVTGTNPAKKYRGRFRETAGRLEAALDETFAERPPALARRADLVWHNGAVGVVIGSDALFVGTNETDAPDLLRVARRDWAKAWSVGNG